MEYIIHFLENKIVVNWIAPIATTLVATALIRIFTIGKKQKKINYANKKYVDAISPYMIQKLKLKIEILYSIKNAISIETGVSKKDLYSTKTLKDVLIYNVLTTQFITEAEKTEIAQHIISFFSEIDINKSKELQRNKNRKRKIIILMTVGIILLTVGMIMYFINPEKSQDLNSFYAGIVSGLLSMATLCLVSVVWIVTGWISLNDGDILFQQIAETISSSLPVFKRKKYKKRDQSECNQDSSQEDDKNNE